jgi:modification methylase
MPEARKKTGHPAAKPQELLVQLLKLFTDPGDLILDPWFGTGSLGVAALTLGRRFVGIEMQQEYVDTALSRIAKVEAQLPLFGDANGVARPAD